MLQLLRSYSESGFMDAKVWPFGRVCDWQGTRAQHPGIIQPVYRELSLELLWL